METMGVRSGEFKDTGKNGEQVQPGATGLEVVCVFRRRCSEVPWKAHAHGQWLGS